MKLKDAQLGFTFVEILITIAIVGVLTTIALVTYDEQMRKSRRADAKISLQELAQRQETFFADNNTYTTDLGSPGGLRADKYGFKNVAADQAVSKDGHYSIKVTANGDITRTFLLTASALSTSPQAKDAKCKTFTIDSTGAKTATGTDTTDCWK